MSFFQKYRLVLIVSLLLVFAFGIRTYFVYHNSRELIRNSIIEQGLPLTGDTIYSEINKDILRPVFISSLMANDTFLKDWIKAGETDPTQIQRYLQEVKTKYGTVSSFLISEKTHHYYYGSGILKTVSETDRHDVWYFKARQMKTDFEIVVDTDEANRGKLTVFINHRVLGEQGQLLGITGVGLTLDKIAAFVSGYEKRFNRHIFFANQQGHIVLADQRVAGQARWLKDIPGLSPHLPKILHASTTQDPLRLEYRQGEHNMLLNVRYLPDLGWYLLVEQDETDALSFLNRDLLVQLFTSIPIMLLILAIIVFAIQKDQNALTQMAATDPLTGCLNRHAFLEKIPAWKRRSGRHGKPPQVLLVDLDHFKQINDQFGHLEGDALLKQVASLLLGESRKGEMVVRWGGEEFLLFLQRSDPLAQVAERLRKKIAAHALLSADASLRITASIGATEWQADEAMDAVLARADAALYTAKHEGRNRFSLR